MAPEVVGMCLEAGREWGTVTGSEESRTPWANLPPGPSSLHIDTVVVKLTLCVVLTGHGCLD